MNIIKNALNKFQKPDLSIVKQKIKSAALISYGVGISIGGVIGFVEGLDKAHQINNHREKIKLQESLKNYEYLLNSMYSAGTYGICSIGTAFTSMAIVAAFPISIPILLEYKEKSKKE
jgi:hypothetical protein